MEILGVGASEFVFILIIALIILGRKDMQKAGKTIGKWLRNIVTSDGWKMFQQTSRELRTLPNRLMREANEELGDRWQRIEKHHPTSSTISPKDRSVHQAPSLRLWSSPRPKIKSSRPPRRKPKQTKATPK